MNKFRKLGVIDQQKPGNSLLDVVLDRNRDRGFEDDRCREPDWAAPALPDTAALAILAPNTATDVRYYRDGYRHGYRHRGGAIVGGLALGVIGAAAVEGYHRDRAYGAPYGYGGNSDGYGSGYGSYDRDYIR